MQMDTEAQLAQRPTSVPRPRPFPILEGAPGPRCGHTLTTISGPDGDMNRAKLILFGAHALIAASCKTLPVAWRVLACTVPVPSVFLKTAVGATAALQGVPLPWRAPQPKTLMAHHQDRLGQRQVGVLRAHHP